MKISDITDKEVERQKRQEKKERKEIERRMREEEEEDFDNEQTVVTLGAPDLDRDLQYDNGSDVEEPVSNPKWFEDDDKSKNTNDGFVEYDEPETLEDLESLTARLIGN